MLGVFGVVLPQGSRGQEETVITYDVEAGELRLDARCSGPAHKPANIDAAPFRLKPGEKLQLRVFVDRSVVEVFVNRRQAVARIVHPSKTSLDVCLFAETGNATVHEVKAWQIAPSNPC